MEQAAILAEVDVLEEAQQYLQLIRDNFLDVKRRVQASGSDDHVSEGSTSMRKCFALLLIGLTVLPPAIQGQRILGSDVNGILYVTPIGGSDLGAQINAAAGGCTTGSQCQIVVVPGAQTSFSTGIVYVANESITCPVSNAIDNTNGSDGFSRLTYTGSGTAVMMGAGNGRFVGCDLLLGSSAIEGIHIGSYSNSVYDAGIRGGLAGTSLIHINGTPFASEDNHIQNTRLSDFVGNGIYIENANDTHLTSITAYGKAGNTTGTSLLVDSNGTGIVINNFVGGNSGLHGLWVRHNLGGLYPTFGFVTNFEADLANSDGILFDGSLGSANIDWTLVNSWSAGSGGTGIHISGGSGITITGGSIIRNNALDGILIDGGSEINTVITGNQIIGNNSLNTTNGSGIRITGHPNAVNIVGNVISNHNEAATGHQKYALLTQSDVEGLVFSNNLCSVNDTGCSNTSTVVTSKLTYSGNINTDIGPPASYFPGTLGVAGAITENGGLSVTQTIGSGTVTTAGTAVAAGTSQGQPELTITGAKTTDVAHCSLNAAPVATWRTGIQLLAPVVTSNTVTVWLSNPTARSITPAATTVRCTVTR